MAEPQRLWARGRETWACTFSSHGLSHASINASLRFLVSLVSCPFIAGAAPWLQTRAQCFEWEKQ